jgi:SAM-dependent methyltransferase
VFETPAEVYDRFMGRYSSELARELVRRAVAGRDGTAIDVGCGPGALTLELAERLGPEHVAAVDPSASFAQACAARLPGVRVQVAGAEQLPFENATFDFALAQLVMNFIADPEAGAGEMRRVTRPGGTVAAAVWDYAGEMVLLRSFWDAAAALDPGAAGKDEGRSMRFGTPEELERLWRSAGLDGTEVEPVTVSATYTGFEDLWAPLERGVGPAGAYAAALEPGDRAALRDELRRRLAVDDKPFSLSARAWVAVGRA